MTTQNDSWPRHSDGHPKKMGEMTTAERKAVTAEAVATLKTEFENPARQKALSDALNVAARPRRGRGQ
jgi:hypothetical protein